MSKPTKNKSAFIRSLPRSMPASGVVKKGAEAGLTFSDKYVWAIRAKMPKRGRPKGKRTGMTSGKGTAAETQFVELALSIGLSKAEALLGRVRSGIRAALG
jgi:hypothetical protein